VLFFFPTFPETEKWLTTPERELAIAHIADVSTLGHENLKITWQDAKATLVDWKLYLQYLLYTSISVPFSRYPLPSFWASETKDLMHSCFGTSLCLRICDHRYSRLDSGSLRAAFMGDLHFAHDCKESASFLKVCRANYFAPIYSPSLSRRATCRYFQSQIRNTMRGSGSEAASPGQASRRRAPSANFQTSRSVRSVNGS
jgi:hypothetical protein